MMQEGLEKFDIGIYVEERVEYIHSRISLKSVLSSIEIGNKLSVEFESRANSSFGRILSVRVKGLTAKIEKKLSLIYGNDRVDRHKRAIEFVGNLISKLFGNPGPEDWKQNTRNILAMKMAIEKQLANSMLLHEDIDQSKHAIGILNENLKQVSRGVINNSNRLANVDNALTELETYLELESLFESISDIIETLEDIRNDAKTGRCNEKGLNPSFLIEHLRKIESNKAGIAPIFASWEWQKYYSFELCTIALNGGEVWITMRIPIINNAEQLIRTIPNSHQHWINEKANMLGIDLTLFKFKHFDAYMVVTKSNLETCSKLGTSRVCNIRKTKFREANPYTVPIDLNHGRLVLLSNISESRINAKNICGGFTKTVLMDSNSVIRLPDNCVILAKTLEISKAASITFYNETLSVGKVENMEFHKIVLPKNIAMNELKEIVLNLNSSQTFDKNNNVTLENLRSVRTNPYASTETWIIASSSSISVLVISVTLINIVIYCNKKCCQQNSNHSNPVVVVVDDKKRDKGRKQLSNEQLDESETEVVIDDPNADLDVSESRKKQKCAESRKPPFHKL